MTKLPLPIADSTVTAVLRLLSNRKVQLVLNGGFGLVLLAVAFFSVRHFIGGGWPIHHADPVLVSGAALLFLVAAAFKAWGGMLVSLVSHDGSKTTFQGIPIWLTRDASYPPKNRRRSFIT